MRKLRFCFLALLAAAPGCTLDFDAVGPGAAGGGAASGGSTLVAGGDSGGQNSGGGGEGGTGGTPPTACSPDRGTCVAVPAGFSPPVRLEPGEGTCAQGTTVTRGGNVDTRGDAIEASDAVCTCACMQNLPSDLGCPNVALEYDATTTICADTNGIGITAVEDGCNAFPTSLSLLVVGPGGEPANANCSSNLAAAMMDEYTYLEPIHVCDDELAPCFSPGEVCVPEGRYCIYAEGVKPTCPEGFEIESEIVLDSAVVDDRDCGCTCADNFTCTPQVILYADGSCSAGDQLIHMLDGSCASSTTTAELFMSARYNPSVGGGCITGRGPPSGGVLAPVVIACCTE